MDQSERTVLLIGGAAVVGFLVLGMLKQRAASQSAYLNEPGLNYQPPVPTYDNTAQRTFADVLSAASGGFSSWLNGGFSSQLGGSNSPGLEDDSYTQSSQQINTGYGPSYADTEGGSYAESVSDVSSGASIFDSGNASDASSIFDY